MTIEDSYVTLIEIIDKADDYNMKLTLMFTAKWADYIIESPERMVMLDNWKQQGHEIAIHHHSTNHSLWGGYTNLPNEVAEDKRNAKGKDEVYLGTMDDFIKILKKLDPDINSGCMHNDSNIVLDEVIYSTGSGLANFGTPLRPLKDNIPQKGINEYISVSEINGIKRMYLTHAQITNNNLLVNAKEIFESMNSTQVYGGVAHSIDINIATGDLQEAGSIMAFMDYLHEQDPAGAKSKTVTEIIEERLLPEIMIDKNNL